jgi:hypothetical protein
MGGLVQIALALSVFAIMTGLGVGELAQYAQSKLPYTIVQRVVSAANLVNNAASSYIVQNTTNCITPTNGLLATSCNFSIGALSGAYLPASQISNGSFVTPDNSHITIAPVSSGTYNLTIVPGAIIGSSTNQSYIQALGHALPGAQCNSSQCVVTEATPSISNMLKANTPAWGTLAPGNGAPQNVNGPLNMNGQPINLGGSYLQWAAQPWGSWVSTLCNGWQQVGNTISRVYVNYAYLGGTYGCTSTGGETVVGPNTCSGAAC